MTIDLSVESLSMILTSSISRANADLPSLGMSYDAVRRKNESNCGMRAEEQGTSRPHVAKRAVTREERMRVDLPLMLGACRGSESKREGKGERVHIRHMR